MQSDGETSSSDNQTDDAVENTTNSELDLDFSEFEDNDEDESDDSNEESTDNSEASDDNDESDNAFTNGFATSKENNAFASMRVQNKELQKTIDELDAIAKGAGLSGYQEFLTKAKENAIAKKAKSEGIPVELARKIDEIDAKLETINSKEQQAIVEAKERKLAGTLDSFVKANNLNTATINKLSEDLAKDGFTIEKLMDMPESAVNRLFSAYTNIGIQKTLDKKSSIKQELPIKQSSKIDGDSINKQLDNFVREIMSNY